MKKTVFAAMAASLFAGVIFAGRAVAQNDEATDLGTLSVTDSADYFRFRSNSVSPRLVYEYEYFSRFEPLSVGDMLKRLPGVAFTSDIGEYDAPQLRGLSNEYTQILINGQRVAGAGDNRGIFVDRIPAEIVERIEIIRSPSADMDSQGIGGSINIVLKNNAEYTGGNFRAGVFRAGEGTTRGSGYVGYGGQSGRLSYMGGIDLQGRYNPKDKRSLLLDADRNAIERAQEDDIRDSLDTSLTGRIGYMLPSGSSLSLQGYYLNTDRDEDQLTDIWEIEDGVEAFDVTEYEHENIEEETLGATLGYSGRFFSTDFYEVLLDYSENTVDIDNVAGELEDGEEFALETETVDTEDREVRLAPSYAWDLSPGHRLKIGALISYKDRDAATLASEFDDESGEFEDETEANAVYQIEETRYDAYLQDIWSLADNHSLEFGMRVEHTRLDQEGFDTQAEEVVSSDADGTEFNPNLHYLWAVTPNDQIRASIARTVRRPNFNDLVPFLTEDDDEFFVGNPDLDSETSIGYDLGYEHRFARQQGIAGINLFYRQIDDLIEPTRVGPATTAPDNVGDGDVWGVELDSSLPLAFVGLPTVSVYGNYSWFDSEVYDPYLQRDRQFQRQPDYTYNIGFTHRIPALRVTWGASFQGQGTAHEVLPDEEVAIDYDGNLEAFVEYQLRENLFVKLNGTNLIDASKDEEFFVYDGARPDGVLDEIEYETETIGRIAILTLRGTF